MTNLLAIPAFIFFQVTWFIHSIRRPLFLVSALCILSNPQAGKSALCLLYK